MKRFGSLVVLALLTSGCDQGGTTTELTRPTTQPAKITPFNGTLQPQQSATDIFTLTQDGYVEVTLVALAAPPGTTVGLALGTPSATGTCPAIYSVTTAAGASAQLVGTGLAGRLCVTIFDVGNLTGAAAFTITVASP